MLNMPNKEQIIELSWDVNDLLSQYLEIHDDVFKISIRHAIPIPGIFKPIDFGAHLKKIENIILELENCDNKIKSITNNVNGQEKEYLDLLLKYTTALIETVDYLKVVIVTLYDKSQNFANSNYDWKNYKKDLAEYKQSVQDYIVIGKCLNESFRKVK